MVTVICDCRAVFQDEDPDKAGQLMILHAVTDHLGGEANMKELHRFLTSHTHGIDWDEIEIQP